MPFPTIRSKWNASGAPVYQLPESLRDKPEWQIQPPTATPPQGQPSTDLGNATQPAQQPRITLPEVYRQQYGGPSTTPPNSLQMPDMTPRVGQGFTPSVNWSDFLTVAHNRYMR